MMALNGWRVRFYLGICIQVNWLALMTNCSAPQSFANLPGPFPRMSLGSQEGKIRVVSHSDKPHSSPLPATRITLHPPRSAPSPDRGCTFSENTILHYFPLMVPSRSFGDHFQPKYILGSKDDTFSCPKPASHFCFD